MGEAARRRGGAKRLDERDRLQQQRQQRLASGACAALRLRSARRERLQQPARRLRLASAALARHHDRLVAALALQQPERRHCDAKDVRRRRWRVGGGGGAAAAQLLGAVQRQRPPRVEC